MKEQALRNPVMTLRVYLLHIADDVIVLLFSFCLAPPPLQCHHHPALYNLPKVGGGV